MRRCAANDPGAEPLCKGHERRQSQADSDS